MVAGNIAIQTMEWVFEHWALFLSFWAAVVFIISLYNDYQKNKLAIQERFEVHQEKIRSYQNTTETTISAMQTARQERHREINRMLLERSEQLDLKIQLARSEARNDLLEYKKEADKKIEEQGKLIQQLLLNSIETNTLLKTQGDILAEIKQNQKENAKFREDFYKEQARK